MKVRTRFAPSPTGLLHIGGVRTALFSWLYARRHGGDFIVRIEDTDRERSSKESIDIILQGLNWLGLDPDEGPFYQTAHLDRYKDVIRQLIDEDNAYYCYCSKESLQAMRDEARAKGEKPRYNGTCRNGAEPHADIKPVVRFKNPLQGEVLINDLIQGEVCYRNEELDDLIIARSDGSPTYNLTVVVDDMDLNITHIIRGDDHLNNTPRQINILNALNASLPVYAHVPMILGATGKKLSKRDTDTVSVLEYRENGILPHALLNYLIRLGWSHGDQEIFSIDEMTQLFDINNVNKAAAALNPDKLLWLNQHYLRAMDNNALTDIVAEAMHSLNINVNRGPELSELVVVQKERCKTVREIVDQSNMFYGDLGAYDHAAAKKHLRPVILEPVKAIRARLSDLKEWDNEALHKLIVSVAESHGLKMGKIAQPLRVAVTGTGVSPSIDDTLRLMGKEQTLARLDQAVKYIENRGAA